MPKARRRAVVVLALISWAVAFVAVGEAIHVSPVLNPQPTKLEMLSSTVKFSLPDPTGFGVQLSLVSVTYTVTGEDIMDNVPLTMDVLVKIPSSYMNLWQIGFVVVMPDNVIGIDTLPNGTILSSSSNFFPLNKLTNMTERQEETWGRHQQILITCFGVLTSTVETAALPTEIVRSINPSAEQAITLFVHNTTSILVESSRTVAAEKNATWATQQEMSLTWLIVGLAAFDIGFRVYDYSSYEKENKTENASNEEP